MRCTANSCLPENIASEDEVESGATNDIKMIFSNPGPCPRGSRRSNIECVRSFLQQPGARIPGSQEKVKKKAV